MHWKSMLRRSLRNLAALSIGLVLSLVAAEIAVRLIPEEKPPRVEPPLFRAARMPFNSLRYRDFDYSIPKGKNVYRIMVAGDSFSAGEGVSFEDSYPKKLELYLNYFKHDKTITYQVANMSRGGRSTPEEVQLIMRKADEIEPDLVILGHCLNDPEDWNGAGRETLRLIRNKCYYYPFVKPRAAVTSFLYNHSALFKLVMHRYFSYRVVRGHTHYYHRLYKDNYPGWQKSQKALCDLGRFSRNQHIPVVVVMFPLFSYGLGDDYPFADIEAKLRQACGRAGLSYLDLFPYYNGMDHIRLEATPFKDPHPSEIAHRIAAEALWQGLMREGVTPDGKRSATDIVFQKDPPKW